MGTTTRTTTRHCTDPGWMLRALRARSGGPEIPGCGLTPQKTFICVSPLRLCDRRASDQRVLTFRVPVDSCVPPVGVTRPKRRRDCFVFKTRIREHWAHALADTGASENFISEELAKFLGLELNPRKQSSGLPTFL